MTLFIFLVSGIRLGKYKKASFFGIAKVLAVERDVKPQNMNFAKVDRRGSD